MRTDQPNQSDALANFDLHPAPPHATVPIPFQAEYPRHPYASQMWNMDPSFRTATTASPPLGDEYLHYPTDHGVQPAFRFAPGVAADTPSSHSAPMFFPGDVANAELSQQDPQSEDEESRLFAQYIDFDHPQLEASNSVNVAYIPPSHQSSSSLASALTMGSSAMESLVPDLPSSVVAPPTQEGASTHSMPARSLKRQRPLDDVDPPEDAHVASTSKSNRRKGKEKKLDASSARTSASNTKGKKNDLDASSARNSSSQVGTATRKSKGKKKDASSPADTSSSQVDTATPESSARTSSSSAQVGTATCKSKGKKKDTSSPARTSSSSSQVGRATRKSKGRKKDTSSSARNSSSQADTAAPRTSSFGFFCDLCQKYVTMSRERHDTKHKEVPEYQCLCGTEFTRKDKRKQHVKKWNKRDPDNDIHGYPNGDPNSGRLNDMPSESSTSSANQLQIVFDDFNPSLHEETTQQQPQASSSRGTVTNRRRRNQDSTEVMQPPVFSFVQENPVAAHPPAQRRKRQKRHAQKASDQSGEAASSSNASSSSAADVSMSMTPAAYGSSYPSMSGVQPNYYSSVPSSSSFYQAIPFGPFPQQQQQTSGLFLPGSMYHQNQSFQNQGPSSVQYHDQSVSPSNNSPPALSSSSSTPESVNSPLVSTPYAGLLPAPGPSQYTSSMPYPIAGPSSYGENGVDCLDTAYFAGTGPESMSNGDGNEGGNAQGDANNAYPEQFSHQYNWRF